MLSIENKLEKNTNDPQSQELYQKVLKEYTDLKPSYDEARPEIKAAHNSINKHNVYMHGSYIIILASMILAGAGHKQKEQ